MDNHPSSQTMCRAILNKRFHTFPSLGNVFIIQLPKIRNVTSQLDNFSRGYYFPIKESLHLSQESMLFLGKDWSHSLALPLKEKGKSLSLTISPSTSLFICISQCSTKLFKCKATSSPTPENCSFITRSSKEV